ncbi:arginine exporter ArgO [Rouxiella badensis]|uniref:arginine exporter ArgO n=1 Tax=Rouxiella badensis TaxID=1646377 RepID=UPI001D139334|nr:arginine exporter ArgO [Rouxiella badensis]MCC3719914.1 arginine exporter ArgO [Rouxiella badensis]MCC3729234.1 arginine exporter ArgO [Rouxiella badensis]MCC3733447.1 arginine exporter ArgO [Rouxiella badensis]MCC3742132.1 arginine exporter ArgO [Rouxiella badensis]MCC3757902.1 arginine exporter ArgO [Rouxiella badensis]
MFSIFLQGMMLSAAMILPIGPQNAFVMNQGIRRQYHLMIAGLCAFSDIVLICGGIFGGSTLLDNYPTLLFIVSWGGVAFLLWFGWGAFRTAMAANPLQVEAKVMEKSRWRIVASMMAVTWLNPHVYLDTFVVLGSLGGRLASDERSWFALGAVLSSTLWFFGLAVLAALLSPWLNKGKTQRAINLVVGVVMWAIALQLALQNLHF